MALTRASEELYVWVAKMSWAEDTWTAKLQSFAMGCKRRAFLEGCSQKLAREFLDSGLRRRMSQDSGLCGNTRCQSKRSIVTETL